MRFQEYLIEVFNKAVDIDVVKDSWQRWEGHFKAADDTYMVVGAILTNQYDDDIRNNFTEEEIKSLTGHDVKKAAENLKKKTSGPKINFAGMAVSEFFNQYPLWIFGFGSKKYGDKILDIRTREEVGTIFSGVKKAAEMFLNKKKPPFLIVDAKSSEKKRLPIYKRFMKEILKTGQYELVGGLRDFKYYGQKTKGWLLKRKGIGKK